MDIPQRPGEKVRKFYPPIAIFLVTVLIVDILFIHFSKIGWVAGEAFSVWIAPPLEEAIKGGIASLLGLLYLALYKKGIRKGMLTRFKPITWAILAGIASGVVFALVESLTQGSPL